MDTENLLVAVPALYDVRDTYCLHSYGVFQTLDEAKECTANISGSRIFLVRIYHNDDGSEWRRYHLP